MEQQRAPAIIGGEELATGGQNVADSATRRSLFLVTSSRLKAVQFCALWRLLSVVPVTPQAAHPCVKFNACGASSVVTSSAIMVTLNGAHVSFFLEGAPLDFDLFLAKIGLETTHGKNRYRKIFGHF